MTKELPSDHEAVFAASAHYLIACRRYQAAIQVLRLCHRLQSHHVAKVSDELLGQLDDVRGLSLELFSEWAWSPPDAHPALAPLGKVLRRVDRLLSKELRIRGVRSRTVYDFLRILEKLPGMYLGPHATLARLSAFLDGMQGSHLRFSRERPSFRLGFQKWVNKRYPSQAAGYPWSDVLAAAAGGDGPEALALFFRELQAYRRAHPNPPLQPTPQSRRG